MNIGLFTDSYFPEISGLATSINILARALKKRGHNVYIFTTTNPNVISNSHGVFRLPSMPFLFLKSRRLGIFYTPRAAKCFKHLKLDIVHIQTEFGIGIFGKMMARKFNIPVVHTYHTMYEEYFYYITKGKFRKLSDYIVRVLTRKICNRCDAVVVPTKKVSDLLIDYGVEKQINIVPTGVDILRFKKENFSEKEIENTRAELGLAKDTPVILSLGRVAKEKSIDVILRQMPYIIKYVPNVKCVIIGDGPATESLKEMTKELHIQNSVIFAGEKLWTEIGKYYRISDIFVSCSMTETQGLTLVEAMASDIPIVVKNDKNIEGFIQNYVNGRIFDSEKELAEILVDLLKNKSQADRLVFKAQETLLEYSAEQFGSRIEKIFLNVIENSQKKDFSRFKLLKQ
jgi:1,2-diacylglycerol 3-alpha-glucosyltransferase